MRGELRRWLLVAIAAVGATVAPAYAQSLPTEPLSFATGRLVIGAEAVATIATADPGYFNDNGEGYDGLRHIRLAVSAELRASRRLQMVAEVRMDQGDPLQAFALYARVRPWPTRKIDVRVGRIPPTFGAHGGVGYGAANLLIGTPLAYQYLTSLRTDALPASVDDLLAMRGRGWRANFPIGNQAPAPGLPLINSVRWDTGVQAHAVHGMVEWTSAWTVGSLSSPRVGDDNETRQLAGRVVIRPLPALAIGASAARGGYLNGELSSALGVKSDVADGVQHALAVDAEYSRDRWLARAELVRSAWQLPSALSGMTVAEPSPTLSALGLLIEARYRLMPGVQIAGRVEHLGFSRLQTASGAPRWEAPVDRQEVGVGCSLTRNVMLKTSWQRNRRPAGRVQRENLAAAQVIYWF